MKRGPVRAKAGYEEYHLLPGEATIVESVVMGAKSFLFFKW